MKLGGPEKVVEIDEMYVCHRKYNRGRPMGKEGTWVLGLTVVDGAFHPIENPRFLDMLKAVKKRKNSVLPREPSRDALRRKGTDFVVNNLPNFKDPVRLDAVWSQTLFDTTKTMKSTRLLPTLYSLKTGTLSRKVFYAPR